jgi:hypothetical protein
MSKLIRLFLFGAAGQPAAVVEEGGPAASALVDEGPRAGIISLVRWTRVKPN